MVCSHLSPAKTKGYNRYFSLLLQKEMKKGNLSMNSEIRVIDTSLQRGADFLGPGEEVFPDKPDFSL